MLTKKCSALSPALSRHHSQSQMRLKRAAQGFQRDIFHKNMKSPQHPSVSRLESLQWKLLSANLRASRPTAAKKLFSPCQAHYQINKYKPTAFANATSILPCDLTRVHKVGPYTRMFLLVSWMLGVDSPLISWCHCSALYSVSECLCFCHFSRTGGAINLKCSVNVRHSMLGFSCMLPTTGD